MLSLVVVMVAALRAGSVGTNPCNVDKPALNVHGASRRAMLTVTPLTFLLPKSVNAFSLPSLLPQEDQAKEATKAASAQASAARMAEMKRIRAERMTSEAVAQSAEYRRLQASVGTNSFGSTVSVPPNPAKMPQYNSQQPSQTTEDAIGSE